MGFHIDQTPDRLFELFCEQAIFAFIYVVIKVYPTRRTSFLLQF